MTEDDIRTILLSYVDYDRQLHVSDDLVEELVSYVYSRMREVE